MPGLERNKYLVLTSKFLIRHPTRGKLALSSLHFETLKIGRPDEVTNEHDGAMMPEVIELSLEREGGGCPLHTDMKHSDEISDTLMNQFNWSL